MNILITNAVPLNGGDEALLRATIETLKQRRPECAITTLCKDVGLARQHLPDLRLESDLEFAREDDLERVCKSYQDADIVLSAPGGFLHDFYAVEARLRGFEFALGLGKPVVLLGQSVGPFWKPESVRRVREVLNRVSRICVRDCASKQHLLNAGVRAEKIVETGDMAFVWRRLAPDLFRTRNQPIRKIGLCFRVWPVKNAAAEKDILAKAEHLCRFLLADSARELVFLSTCQGVAGYADDSELALRLTERLPQEFRARCRINRARLSPRALINAFGECDAFVGMRLHGCILSMLSGAPAMGIGYETKTREIFGQLGLSDYQVPLEAEADDWLSCVRKFLDNASGIRNQLAEKLDRMVQLADLNLAVVDESLPAAQSKSARRSLNSPLRKPEQIMTFARKCARLPGSFEEEIALLIPVNCRFILVDDLQWSEAHPNRAAIPFLERHGEYWGRPENDTVAINELERLRKAGAEFILFAQPCFWWLEYYEKFAEHLRANFCCLLQNERLVVFDLRTSK